MDAAPNGNKSKENAMKKLIIAIVLLAPLAAVIHITGMENGRMHAERIAAEAEERGIQDYIRKQQMEAIRAEAWLKSSPMRSTMEAAR